MHLRRGLVSQFPARLVLYRALAEAGEADTSDDAQVIGPRRPVRARITGRGSGTDPELMERLTAQVLDGDTVTLRQLEDAGQRAGVTVAPGSHAGRRRQSPE
ncbi:hypothetical protein ABH925_006425 [Streptacidiphilus sp. EB129]